MSAGLGQFAAIQAVAPPLGVEVTPVNVREPKEIERDIAAFARWPNGGMIVTGSAWANGHRASDCEARGAAQTHRSLCPAALRRSRRADLLWPQFLRSVPTRGRLRRPHPQGREAGRPAGAGADQVRAGDQPQDRQGARPRRAADAARPRRRGDRISAKFCCDCSRPLMALSGRADTYQICPVLKVDRPRHRAAVTSRFDPDRTETGRRVVK